MESNIEVIDQEVEKARAKYGDKDIPPDEIHNFKVSKLVEFHLYYYFLGKSFLEEICDIWDDLRNYILLKASSHIQVYEYHPRINDAARVLLLCIILDTKYLQRI